jgi:hypothetical protein
MAGTHDHLAARAAGWTNTPMSRRDLLRLGAAGAASLMLAGMTGLHQAGRLDLSPLAALGQRFSEPFSVGFWGTGADTGDDLSIVGANHLSSGDPRFLTDGARVSVLGIYPFDTPEAWAHLEALDIDASFAPYHDLTYRAWSFANAGNGTLPRTTVPTGMSIPVHPRDGMTLNVSYRLAGATETVNAALRFTAGSERNMAKLREGIYLVALPDAAQSLPNWRANRSSVTAVPRGLNRRDWAMEGTVSSHPYIMLSVK